MPKIRKLDESLVNLIAAGEVVERPASVLKELLENAFDAGASRVLVEVEEAGKRRVSVSDDGAGMSPEDALLALERHATSKISAPEHLASVATLGFRGEALPAIAAVSRFELATAEREAGEGVRVRVEPGGAVRADAVVRGPGTSVTVRDLFHTTPARRKFLKSDATELRRLLDVAVEAALSRPDVALTVRSGSRELLRLPACFGLRERVAALYGSDYAAGLLPLEAVSGGRGLSGLLQRPDAAGRGPRRQMLFVNGRPISDRGLAHAVFRGYASTLPEGAWPHAFVFLRLPPDTMDVNVHPAKREVRFREPDALHAYVQSAVREALGGLRTAGELRGARGFRRVPASANGGETPRGGGEPELAVVHGRGRLAHDARGGYRAPRADQLALFLNARVREDREPAARPLPEERPPRLWQLHEAFILAQTGTGLAIIDQHSAHERVLYEAILEAFRREEPESQELVFPRTYELGPAEWEAWEENRGLFERLGFRAEPFGGRALALRAVPPLGRGFAPEEAFAELLADLAEARGSEPNRHERLARALACRAAIKAGQPLAPEEMARLFNDLFATAVPTADVHGRPAVIQIRLEELSRRFERA